MSYGEKFAFFTALILGILALEFLAEAVAVMYPKWKERRKNALRTKLPD